jgi:Na+-translocating ferredoxin:NAD+ oxidoreductase subunit G
VNASLRAALLGGLFLGACALLAAALLSGTERLTRDRIAEARLQAARAALAVVLPPALYDNDPLQDRITVNAPRWLGSARPMQVNRARRGGEAVALAIEAAAPDGYSGAIHLLVGVLADGTVSGVRVVAHQETPGLGDAIEAGRSHWIERFTGTRIGAPPLSRWIVRKDGGEFDQFAGATITPRAVVSAVRRVLQYVEAHGTELFDAEAGVALRHDDAPGSAAPAAAAGGDGIPRPAIMPQ